MTKILKMKKVVLVILLGLSLSVSGQTKRTELFKQSFGGVEVLQKKSEDETTGTLISTMLIFQNQKYAQISDLKIIGVFNKESLDLLISNLEKALAFSKSGEKSQMEFKDAIAKYSIEADGGNGRITLNSYRQVSGYIYVHPKNIIKIIEVLNVIKVNYDK
jgi:hypothetical protein